MQRPKKPNENDQSGLRVHTLNKNLKSNKNEGSNISMDEEQAVEGAEAIAPG